MGLTGGLGAGKSEALRVLAELGALVLPGTIVELPGWFRISLTASDEMVESGLRAFQAARG